MDLEIVAVKYPDKISAMIQLGYKYIGKVHYLNSEYYDGAFEYEKGIYEDLKGIHDYGDSYLQQRLAEIRQSKSKVNRNANGEWDF